VVSYVWKTELQGLGDDIGLEIGVCHFPPGTSKWNRIEHRLFSFITHNWRGKPLESLQVIVNPDRGNKHPHRPDRPRPTRPAHLPQNQGRRRRTRRRADLRRPLPPRMELHHQTTDLMMHRPLCQTCRPNEHAVTSRPERSTWRYRNVGVRSPSGNPDPCPTSRRRVPIAARF
jgi:hypothetical protein